MGITVGKFFRSSRSDVMVKITAVTKTRVTARSLKIYPPCIYTYQLVTFRRYFDEVHGYETPLWKVINE